MDRRLSLIVLALALGTASREADASLVTYIATLTGANEAPPNASPGTGFAEIDFDTTAHTLRVHVLFSDLLGPTTAAPHPRSDGNSLRRNCECRHDSADVRRLPVGCHKRDLFALA